MNKRALQNIQEALNAIHSEIECVNGETKWAALELMLGRSCSLVALAKKMVKLETKSDTHNCQSKDEGSQTTTKAANNTKRQRKNGLYSFSSTTSVTKSTRRQRKTLGDLSKVYNLYLCDCFVDITDDTHEETLCKIFPLFALHSADVEKIVLFIPLTNL